MGEPRLSSIIIGILLVGVFATAFMGFLGAGADKYGLTDYSNDTFDTYNAVTEEAKTTAQNSKNNTDTLGAAPSDEDFDIFGSLFSSSWTAVKTTDDSMDQLVDIGAQAQQDTGTFFNPTFSTQLFAVLGAIISVIFIIAILLHFIAKSNRL